MSKAKINKVHLNLTVNGKKVKCWFDFDLYKAEQEWIKKKENELFAHFGQNAGIRQRLGIGGVGPLPPPYDE